MSKKDRDCPDCGHPESAHLSKPKYFPFRICMYCGCRIL